MNEEREREKQKKKEKQKKREMHHPYPRGVLSDLGFPQDAKHTAGFG